jgi:LysM repeat protein
MAEQLCRFCDNPATGRCEECGRFYCAQHGDVVCATCGDPNRGVPGAVLFRGTLLALVAGVVVAVVLIVNPPETDSEEDSPPVATVAEQTEATAIATISPEATGTSEDAGTEETEPPASTPAPTGTATASATPAGETYTVEFGDTLSGIADQFGVTLDELIEANDIADPNNVEPGTVLVIP